MRLIKALIISLLVYALLVWLFMSYFSQMLKVPKVVSKPHIIKIDIRDIPTPAPPKPQIKHKAKVSPIEKKLVAKKPIIKKPIIKKTEKVVKKKKVAKKKIIKKKVIKKVKKKPVKKKKIIKKKKIVVKKTPAKKKVIQKEVIQKEVVPKEIVVSEEIFEEEIFEQEVVNEAPLSEEVVTEEIAPPKSDSLEAFEQEMVYIAEPMLKPKKLSASSVTPWSYPNNKIRKLYGREFHDFTATQKEFIENNLESIQAITQRTLTQRGYPEGAGRTGQEGTNVVSFNLHPNGDISDLRLKTRIGYRALDENTLSLIRVAYMDYPYPTMTTKIVFYVKYSIYGY